MISFSPESLIPTYRELCLEENIRANQKIISYLDRKVVKPCIFWLSKYDNDRKQKNNTLPDSRWFHSLPTQMLSQQNGRKVNFQSCRNGVSENEKCENSFENSIWTKSHDMKNYFHLKLDLRSMDLNDIDVKILVRLCRLFPIFSSLDLRNNHISREGRDRLWKDLLYFQIFCACKEITQFSYYLNFDKEVKNTKELDDSTSLLGTIYNFLEKRVIETNTEDNAYKGHQLNDYHLFTCVESIRLENNPCHGLPVFINLTDVTEENNSSHDIFRYSDPLEENFPKANYRFDQYYINETMAFLNLKLRILRTFINYRDRKGAITGEEAIKFALFYASKLLVHNSSKKQRRRAWGKAKQILLEFFSSNTSLDNLGNISQNKNNFAKIKDDKVNKEAKFTKWGNFRFFSKEIAKVKALHFLDFDLLVTFFLRVTNDSILKDTLSLTFTSAIKPIKNPHSIAESNSSPLYPRHLLHIAFLTESLKNLNYAEYLINLMLGRNNIEILDSSSKLDTSRIEERWKKNECIRKRMIVKDQIRDQAPISTSAIDQRDKKHRKTVSLLSFESSSLSSLFCFKSKEEKTQDFQKPEEECSSCTKLPFPSNQEIMRNIVDEGKTPKDNIHPNNTNMIEVNETGEKEARIAIEDYRNYKVDDHALNLENVNFIVHKPVDLKGQETEEEKENEKENEKEGGEQSLSCAKLSLRSKQEVIKDIVDKETTRKDETHQNYTKILELNEIGQTDASTAIKDYKDYKVDDHAFNLENVNFSLHNPIDLQDQEIEEEKKGKGEGEGSLIAKTLPKTDIDILQKLEIQNSLSAITKKRAHELE